MRRASVAGKMLARPNFADDNNWHRLDELREFEDRLSLARQRDAEFSNAVRIDGSLEEKIRRDELLPFLHFARHESLPGSTLFRKPKPDVGVDIEYKAGGSVVQLQITTAYPVWRDQAGNPQNGGHQHRLLLEKLGSQNTVIGFGPFERCGDRILNNEQGLTQHGVEEAYQLGLENAFRAKSSHRAENISLLIRAVGYSEVMDAECFHALVASAAQHESLQGFARVIVVDTGDGFMCSLEP